MLETQSVAEVSGNNTTRPEVLEVYRKRLEYRALQATQSVEEIANKQLVAADNKNKETLFAKNRSTRSVQKTSRVWSFVRETD